MTTELRDDSFLRNSPFTAQNGGLESARIDPGQTGGKPTPAQKARAIEAFLRGEITADQLARARSEREAFIRIVGKPQSQPMTNMTQGMATVSATCAIRASGKDETGRSTNWNGTGVMISHDILFTTYRNARSAADASNSYCVFESRPNTDGSIRPPGTYRLRPDILYIASPAEGGLDYAFVHVEGEPGKDFGFVRPDRSSLAVSESECVNLIRHDENGRTDNRQLRGEVLWQDDLVIHYATDEAEDSRDAAVCDMEWKLVALHRATRPMSFGSHGAIHEGVKLSAIAEDLEKQSRKGTESAHAALKVLESFEGVDERFGFFGTCGGSRSGQSGLEAVVEDYVGDSESIDVGFWNVEWLTTQYEAKATAVARVIRDMRIDVWCISESSKRAAQRVVDELSAEYGLNYECASAEPDAEDGKQVCTLIWNTETVEVEPAEWGEPIETWMRTRSTDFDDLGLGGLEAIHGRIFDRYPALFKVRPKWNASGTHSEFHLVPLHLKAKSEGSLRRRMASKILAEAIEKKIAEGAISDWIIGGDFNASLDSDDFRSLERRGFLALSSADASDGAFSYVKGPKSLIDHIFVSRNLADRVSSDDFLVVAKDKTFPGFVKRVSDHRPVLVRMLRKNSQTSPESAFEHLPEEGFETSGESDDDVRDESFEDSMDEFEGGLESKRRSRRPDRDSRSRATFRSFANDDSKGYSIDFLGSGSIVPLPGLSNGLHAQAVEVDPGSQGIDRYVLPYTHFSIVMNGERKLPFYSAVNIDGNKLVRLPRSNGWSYDRRIPEEFQAGSWLYHGRPLDRGHMTRRLDPVWGPIEIAQRANDDTFFYTNACPQHRDLNQKEWLELEDYVLSNAVVHELKVSVITGPVLRDDDNEFRSVKLPKEFWKVVVIVRAETQELSATGYVLSHEKMIRGLERLQEPFLYEEFKTYQVSIARIAESTKLDFGRLPEFDPLGDVRRQKDHGLESARDVPEIIEIRTSRDLRL